MRAAKPLAILLLLLASTVAGAAEAASHAVVIMYHRFGDGRYPSTNTTIEQFEAHLEELASGGYTVLPLAEVVQKVKAGEPMPDRAVAITVDDAYASVYEEAFPRFMEYGFPFTLFIATQSVGEKPGNYASWNQIREMQAAGVDIGSQTHSHPHLHRLPLAEVREEIETSNRLFLGELGLVPSLHAYPFGEYSPEVRDLMREMGFDAAFGQHSGVMHSSQNPYEFPRFTFNENYGSIDRLRLVLNALPVPVEDMTPESGVLTENPPLIGFTVPEGVEPLGNLTCFASGIGAVKTITLGRRIELRLPEPFESPRARINCTMPYFDNGQDTGRWRWFGRQFVQP